MTSHGSPCPMEKSSTTSYSGNIQYIKKNRLFHNSHSISESKKSSEDVETITPIDDKINRVIVMKYADRVRLESRQKERLALQTKSAQGFFQPFNESIGRNNIEEIYEQILSKKEKFLKRTSSVNSWNKLHEIPTRTVKNSMTTLIKKREKEGALLILKKMQEEKHFEELKLRYKQLMKSQTFKKPNKKERREGDDADTPYRNSKKSRHQIQISQAFYEESHKNRENNINSRLEMLSKPMNKMNLQTNPLDQPDFQGLYIRDICLSRIPKKKNHIDDIELNEFIKTTSNFYTPKKNSLPLDKISHTKEEKDNGNEYIEARRSPSRNLPGILRQQYKLTKDEIIGRRLNHKTASEPRAQHLDNDCLEQINQFTINNKLLFSIPKKARFSRSKLENAMITIYEPIGVQSNNAFAIPYSKKNKPKKRKHMHSSAFFLF